MSETPNVPPRHQYEAFLRQLPADWEQREITQVGAVVGGGTPSRAVPSFWRGSIPWVTPGEVSGEAAKLLHDTNEHISAAGLAGSGANLLPTGSLLVTTRATLGARVINAVPMATNQGFKSIVFKKQEEASYYYHLFEKVKPELVRRASGTTFLEISGAEFGSIRVPSPSPAEKLKIAQLLDTLDTAIHQTEAIVKKLKQVKQGLLYDLLTRGVGANGELRPCYDQAPDLYKQTPGGWIPREWEVAPLVSKISFPEGQVDPRRTPYRDWTLVAPDHIEAQTGRLISKVSAADQNAISGKYVFAPNDIIYSKIRPYLRKAVLADDFGLCSADMYPLRPNDGVAPRFILAVMLGHIYSRFAESVSMRSGFPKINRNEMAEFSMGWPSSDEQKLIADFMEQADREQALEEIDLQKLQQLKAGLMDDLLTGRIRVTPLLAQ
ncbi:restriction endonuclease subunit S [Zoogloea sp.]|uniref:restriction endonuclease subunit S n=1 Tax=Zoogloea sp. TaxID=49181 RepID=UPI0035AF319F